MSTCFFSILSVKLCCQDHIKSLHTQTPTSQSSNLRSSTHSITASPSCPLGAGTRPWSEEDLALTCPLQPNTGRVTVNGNSCFSSSCVVMLWLLCRCCVMMCLNFKVDFPSDTKWCEEEFPPVTLTSKYLIYPIPQVVISRNEVVRDHFYLIFYKLGL